MLASKTVLISFAIANFLCATTTFSSESPGKASCADIVAGVGCELRWDFTDNGRHSYTAQQWDKDSKRWVNIDSTQSFRSSNTRLGCVEGGRLYKVEACEATLCSSSNVVWAPDWTPVEEIPDVIYLDVPNREDRDFAMRITKNAKGKPMEPRMVIAQHNMYLATVEAIEFYNSSEEMPEMETPPSYDPGPKTVEEMVRHNVHKSYQELRAEILRDRQ